MPETQIRREAPTKPPPETPAESAASRAERQQLFEEAEMAVRQVTQAGLPVAEELAAEHGATVPPTYKLKLLGLVQIAQRALDYLKRDILKMPTAEVQALYGELKELVEMKVIEGQTPAVERLEKIRALALRLAWADPELAQKSIALTKENLPVSKDHYIAGHPLQKLVMAEAFGEVFIENNPAGVESACQAVMKVWPVMEKTGQAFNIRNAYYLITRPSSATVIARRFLTENNLSAYLAGLEQGKIKSSDQPPKKDILSWQTLLAIKAGDFEGAFSFLEKNDYRVSYYADFRKGESFDLENTEPKKIFQALATSFIESINQSKIIEQPEKKLARAYQLFNKSILDSRYRTTDYYGSTDIPLELEACIRRLTQQIEPHDLLAAVQTAPEQIRDRYLEDWAVATVGQNPDQMIKVLEAQYGQQIKQVERSEYLANFYVLLSGVVKPVEVERFRQLALEKNRVRQYARESDAEILEDDPRLARYPAAALNAVERNGQHNVKEPNNESAAQALLIGRLYRVDPLAAGQRAMDFLDGHTGSSVEFLFSAAAKYSPEHTLTLLEYHTRQPYEEKYFRAIAADSPPDKLGPLLVLAESRGRPEIFDGLLRAITDRSVTIAAAAPWLHLLSTQAQHELISNLVHQDSWVSQARPKSPLLTFRSLSIAAPNVRQKYCGELSGYFRDKIFNQKKRSGQFAGHLADLGMELQSAFQPDMVDKALSDQRWAELESLYGHDSEKLVFAALWRLPEANAILGAALQIKQKEPDLNAEVICRALTEEENKPMEILAALNDPRFDSLDVLKKPLVRLSVKKELLFVAGRQTIFSFLESAELAAAAAVTQERFPDLLHQFLEYYKSTDPAVQAVFRSLVGSAEFKRAYELLPGYRDSLISRVVHEPEKYQDLFARLRKAKSKVAFIFELATHDSHALTEALKVISPEEVEEAAENIVEQRLPWEMILKLPLTWPQRQKFLEQRAANLAGEFPGSKILAQSLERGLRSEESFEGNRAHLLNISEKLKERPRPGRSEAAAVAALLDRILGAQEMIANKNLRNRLEKYLLTSNLQKSAASFEIIAQTPDRMSASLDLLAEPPLNLEAEKILRLGQTMFEGKVLKKQTDLDRFNYFLLEGVEEKIGDAMRSFFDQSIPLMERTPKAKRLVFELSQIMRSFGAIEGSFGPRLANLNAELQKLAEIIVVTPKFKNPADTAKFVANVDKQIVDGLQRQLADLSQQLVESFQAKVGFALSKDETIKFLESFDNPSLVFVYLGKLDAYPHQLGLYRQFIESVAKGGFPDIRYSLNRDHLDQVFAGQSQKEALWRENLNLKKIAQQENSPAIALRQRIADIIGGALDDGHIPEAAGRLVGEFANSNPEQRTQILARTRSEISNLNLLVRLATPETDEKIKKMKEGIKKKLTLDKQQELALTELAYTAPGSPSLEESLNQAEAAYKLMLLLDARPEHLASGQIEISKEGGKKQSLEVKELLKEVRERQATAEVFINDLTAIEKAILSGETGEEAMTISGRLLVEESEDPDLMLRSGTDVDGSCQNVNGDPKLNRNLVSYIMDGKIKILLVRDADGAIVSRSVMRLLYDEKAKTPVIHLERSYHRSGAPIEISNLLLLDLARAKAQQCQYPLIVSGRFNAQDKLTAYQNPIVSYGGPGDTEYVDSISGAQPGQKYTITSDKISLVV